MGLIPTVFEVWAKFKLKQLKLVAVTQRIVCGEMVAASTPSLSLRDGIYCLLLICSSNFAKYSVCRLLCYSNRSFVYFLIRKLENALNFNFVPSLFMCSLGGIRSNAVFPRFRRETFILFRRLSIKFRLASLVAWYDFSYLYTFIRFIELKLFRK